MNPNAPEIKKIERELDTTIHYTVAGPPDGRAVVFVHGWGCRRSDFEGVIASVPPSWRTVAVDLAENGDSRSSRETFTMADFADDVAAVLDAEGLDGTVVVGHSMGGAVAVELAHRRPGLVERIIGLDSFHYLGIYPRIDEAAVRPIVEAIDADFVGTVRGMVELGSIPETDPAFKEKIFEKMSHARLPAGATAVSELFRWDMDDRLPQVEQPITALVIDALFDRAAITRYGDRIEFIPISLGSHHFLVEQPEATAGLITDLVDGSGKEAQPA